MTLQAIETAVCLLADRAEELRDLTRDCEEAIEQITSEYSPTLRKLAAEVSTKHGAALGLIGKAEDLFLSPKSVKFACGWRAGFRKMPGSVEIADEKSTLAALRKHLGKHAESYIITTEKVNKRALVELTGRDLSAIGVVLVETTDQPFAAPDKGDVLKMVEHYLKAPAAKNGKAGGK